jgi:hypothetical protein
MSIRALLAIIVAALCLSLPAFSQDTETVTIPKSQLTDQQKADLAANALKAKTDQYGKWVGIGHEVGVAVNEGMSAVTTQANNFAQTPVGKWTMFVIIFKVVGNTFMGYIIGAVMAVTIMPFWIWSYRKYLPKKYLKKVNYDPTTGKKISEDYGYGVSDEDMDEDVLNGWKAGHWGFLAAWFIAIFVIMFANN